MGAEDIEAELQACLAVVLTVGVASVAWIISGIT
jgi:hypothetical protein